MQTQSTEIIFLLDRSGSMNICEEDVIGGYNSFLDRQKQDNSQAFVTTVLFDNRYELLHDHVEIHNIEHISGKEYFARGTTALLDAIGLTISNVSERQSKSKNISQTIMVIMTDGLDNVSKKYRIKNIYEMIQEQQKNNNWEFIFLGANIDAIKTANSIGISSERASNFTTNTEGLNRKFTGISKTVTHFRTSGKINNDWKSD